MRLAHSIALVLAAVVLTGTTRGMAPNASATQRPVFDMTFVQQNVSAVANNAVVTPTLAPANLAGKLVIRGSGAPVYSQGRPGVAFFKTGQQNNNTSFYAFSGSGVGDLFEYRVAGHIELSVESRYTFAERKNLVVVENNRHIFRTAFHASDGNGTTLGRILTYYRDEFLIFGFQFFNSGAEYFVPKGTEDLLFGKNVTVKLKLVWDGNGSAVGYINDKPEFQFKYPTTAPNWSSNSVFSIGASNATDYGGGFWASDDPLLSLKIEGSGPYLDTTPPVVSLIEPQATSTQRGIIRICGKATDNIGVASAQFLLDGVHIGGALVGGYYQTLWDTRTVQDGNHVLTMRVVDQLGNTAQVSANVIIANASPLLVDRPPGPIYNLRTVHSELGLIQIGWDSSTDDVGISLYEVYRDGSNIGTAPQGALTSINTFTDTGVQAWKAYSYQVLAVDTSGRRSPISAPITISTGSGRTLYVGPGKTYAKPCAAILSAQDGDTIEVDASGNGSYDGDVCRWTQSNLTVRGVNGVARVDAAGKDSSGKAIWVIAGKNATIENIELSGCKVSDGNGAGIRGESQGLVLRRVYFHHNQNGILIGYGIGGNVTIEFSEFSHNGTDGSTHNMYIGDVDSFTLRYS